MAPCSLEQFFVFFQLKSCSGKAACRPQVRKAKSVIVFSNSLVSYNTVKAIFLIMHRACIGLENTGVVHYRQLVESEKCVKLTYYVSLSTETHYPHSDCLSDKWSPCSQGQEVFDLQWLCIIRNSIVIILLLSQMFNGSLEQVM